MAEVRQYTVYKFDELSAEAQAKAIELNRDFNTEGEWYDGIYDQWIEKLSNLGYFDPKIEFSGFWSQGDGASFTAEHVDAKVWLKAHKLANKYRTLYNSGTDGWAYSLSVDRIDHHYSHENTVSASGEWLNGYDKPKGHDDIEAVVELVTEEVRTLSKQIYKELEAEHEYLTSDDAVRESLIINEYDYTEDGVMA